MKQALIALMLFTLTTHAAEKHTAQKNESNVVSYAIGYDIGKNLTTQVENLNHDLFIQAFKDAQSNTKPMFDVNTQQEYLTAYKQKLFEKQIQARKDTAMQNLEAGQKFLTENQKKEGVITLDSGLQYEVIESGEGDTPGATDNVTTHYRGTLLDGSEFDSSYKRGQPASFPVNGVIAGWTEALQKMKEGDKWKLYIPSHLAYGERGAGASIPPNSTLIFDIELIKVN